MHSADCKPEKRTEKQTLVKELKELLSSCEGQRVPVATVLALYYQHFGRLLKIGDYGARRLEDLIDGLPSLQVSIVTELHNIRILNPLTAVLEIRRNLSPMLAILFSFGLTPLVFLYRIRL